MSQTASDPRFVGLGFQNPILRLEGREKFGRWIVSATSCELPEEFDTCTTLKDVFEKIRKVDKKKFNPFWLVMIDFYWGRQSTRDHLEVYYTQPRTTWQKVRIRTDARRVWQALYPTPNPRLDPRAAARIRGTRRIFNFPIATTHVCGTLHCSIWNMV